MNLSPYLVFSFANASVLAIFFRLDPGIGTFHI